jgi:hypothetical protein
MKISTNFADPVQRAVRPFAAALWLMALASAVGTGWLLGDAAERRAKMPDLQQQLASMTTAGPAVAARPMPSAQELAQTRDRVAAINAAAQTRGVSPPSLLARLEALLPQKAWLASFHHRAADGEVLLVAAAASAGPLSGFLLALERDPLFEEAMLMREMQPSGSGKGGVQFEIRLKVRP